MTASNTANKSDRRLRDEVQWGGRVMARGRFRAQRFGVRRLVAALRRSGLVRAAGARTARPQNTPPAETSFLPPQSADKSAHSKALRAKHGGGSFPPKP